MRGRNFGIGLLLFFFPMVVCSQDLIHSFLPIVKGHYFYLIETHGSHKITIDRWGTAPTSTLESLLKDVRQGRLSNPQRFFLTRNTNGFYELDSHSKTPDTLSPTFGFTEYNGSLFIAHREGIDEIDLSSLLEADESKVIDIKSFKPLPFATGIVFLKSVFKNDLMITSQWDPSQDSSTLSIFLDDDTKINEWQLNFPLLNLSLEALTLFAAGGKEGLHINQDAKLSLGNFESGKSIDCKMKKGNGLFVFMIKGKTQVDQDVLGKRDSIGISGVDSVEIKAIQDSKILLIEVPMKE